MIHASIVLMAVLGAGPAAPVVPPAWTAAVDAALAQGLAGEVGLTDRHATLSLRVASAPQRPHRAGERWRWASVTKQVTATLVLQQVAEHRLGLDDTLAERLPAFHGPTAAAITIRMLLTHTSGLPNPDDTPPEHAAGADGKPDAFGYCAGPAKAAPGAGFAYDNCDYLVLGAVLERVTGRSFAALVQERIATPLGLHRLALATDRDARRTVPGLVDATTREPTFNLATFGASGALTGEPTDLLAFDRALLGGVLLDPAATASAWHGDPALGYVALGAWAFPATLRGCTGQVLLVERRGEIGGIEVRNLIAPDAGRAIVVFADRADLDFGEIWQGRGLSWELASAGFCP